MALIHRALDDQKNFEREGYAGKTRSGIRLTPYHLLPESLVIIAKDGDFVVATVSILPRTPFWIPLDAVIGKDPRTGRPSGKEVEISALAVDSNYAGNFGEVLYSLMKFMYHCHVDLLGTEIEPQDSRRLRPVWFSRELCRDIGF